MAMCAGDLACLFDVAVTNRVDIGLATRMASEELAMFEALTVPGGLTVLVYTHIKLYFQVKLSAFHSVCIHVYLYTQSPWTMGYR